MSEVIELGSADIVPEPSSPWLQAIDRWAERIGDRLNPILVKEARQALKSRRFFATFSALLLMSWLISLVGLAMTGPNIVFGQYGPQFFIAYFGFLAFALLVIVPYGAFRSLAVEQEERTYELLSITAMNPRQIVAGKLGSAIVQMFIYLSAISPCLAFTYLLRGIDLPTMLFVLGWTVLLSIGLSAIGLLLGTLALRRTMQALVSVGAIIGLMWGFIGAMALASTVLFEEAMPFEDLWFWQLNGGLFTAYLSTFALVFYAAVAQITFAFDNRSSRLRACMMVQYLSAAAWAGWAWFGPAKADAALLWAFTIASGIYWFVMGSMMTGEQPELSLRVRRGLPQSFMGRMFLTWFNPGPGTGYVFAISGCLTTLLLVLAAYPQAQSRPWARGEDLLTFAVVGLCYVVIYLGVGLLLLRLVRRKFRADAFGGAMIQIVLILFGCAMPALAQELVPGLRFQGYSLMQVTNFAWTLAELADGRLPNYVSTLLVLLPVAAVLLFVLNLPGIARELRRVRVTAPVRVLEEDAQLAALVSPPAPPAKESPWD